MNENADNTTPEEFDNIMASASGFADTDVTEASPGDLWDAVETVWPDLMKGHVLTKGIIIVEYIGPDGRQLRWESADGMAEWDVIGQLRSALLDVETQNLAMQLVLPVVDYSDDEPDDDIEDDQ